MKTAEQTEEELGLLGLVSERPTSCVSRLSPVQYSLAGLRISFLYSGLVISQVLGVVVECSLD